MPACYRFVVGAADLPVSNRRLDGAIEIDIAARLRVDEDLPTFRVYPRYAT